MKDRTKSQEPAKAEILRTGGDPKDGQCNLADDTIVVAY